MVEDIESLRAELQRQTLMDGKLPANRQVHLPGPETSNEVAWRGSGATLHERVRIEGNTGKRIRIHRAPSRAPVLKNLHAIRAIHINRLVRNQIQTRGECPSRSRIKIAISGEGDREAASGGEAVIEAPVVQQRIHETVVPRIRQVIGERPREIVPHVKVAIPALVAEIIIILRAVIDAVRPGVGGQCRHSSAQSPTKLDLRRVVIRGQPIADEEKFGGVRISGGEYS